MPYFWLSAYADFLVAGVSRHSSTTSFKSSVRRWSLDSDRNHREAISRGLRNMYHLYLPLVDTAYVYDNTGSPERAIAERQPGGQLIIHDAARWALIEQAVR